MKVLPQVIGAFWMSDEKKIRYVSLIGTPCWFVYNFMSRAYGSAVGDAYHGFDYPCHPKI